MEPNGQITAFNQVTLATGWSDSDKKSQSLLFMAAEGDLVQTDGNVLLNQTESALTRINPGNGGVVWSIPFPPNSSFILTSGTVLTKTGPRNCKVALLQAADGHQLWCDDFSTPPEAVRIYLGTQNAVILELPSTNTDSVTGKQDLMEVATTTVSLESLAVQPTNTNSVTGKQDLTEVAITTISLENLAVQHDRIHARFTSGWQGDLIIGDKVYTADHKMRSALTANFTSYHTLRKDGELPGYWTVGDGMQEPGTFMFPLPSGVLSYTADVFSARRQIITTFTSGTKTTWKSVIPYLNEWRYAITAVRQYGNKLVLGTSSGQVECLDLETGTSQWKYTFPVGTLPVINPPLWIYDEHATARKYWHRYEETIQFGNSVVVPENASTSTRNIASLVERQRNKHENSSIDPKIVDPFSELPRKLLYAWTSFFILAALLLRNTQVLIKKKILKRYGWGIDVLGLLFAAICLLRFHTASWSTLLGLFILVGAYAFTIVWLFALLLKRSSYYQAVALTITILIILASLYEWSNLIIPDSSALM